MRIPLMSVELLLIAGVYSIWGFVRPNNWQGYQTCAVLKNDLEYKMGDEDCGKPDYYYICGDIRTSRCRLDLDMHKLQTTLCILV